MTTTAIRDYSELHTPTGALGEPPATKADWHQYRLTDEQIQSFHRDGYLAGVPILNDDQVEKLRAELAGLMDPGHPSHQLFHEYHSNESSNPETILFHALGAWRTGPAFHDVLWTPASLVAASQLLDGAVRFWHDQLFCKPAHHGGVVAWHQDYSYWTRTQPMQHLTCWIALDDSTVDNGCLYYVPGSHTWQLLPITGLAGDMNEIMTVLNDEQKEAFRPVPIEIKRGQCSFHHPLTVHGSYENRSDRPRRAKLINAFREGVRSASDEPLLKGVPAISKGRKMEGRFFPLLFDPDSFAN
ncbi:phytanoyl-CoA dioxygenase family protein [Occallatibacter savannae]|uniref:phytanoyl-CoA dioxygenase family protein n=1 Tax=Occallatibacter savannae TaxID=1002691 RepID=UPI000D698B22|nr:phytanoyl-CoA dioxygenase family protein [Occallatibacter savannae]